MTDLKHIFEAIFKSSNHNAIIIAFTLVFSFLSGAIAQQDSIPPSQLILKDKVDIGDTARNGLINKLIQPFRFRENIRLSERKRVVNLLRRLTTQGDLAIDSATVQSITDELLELTGELMATTDTTVQLREEIARTIQNLDSKAPQTLVDSIQIQVGNVLQGLLDQSKAERLAEKGKLAEALFQLRQIGLSCGAPGLPTLRDTLGDTLVVDYQICLKAKLPIFAWHSPAFNQEFQGYNLNYLTDLILESYQLGENGIESNPKGLQSSLDSAVLAKSKAYGKRILLSVHSISAERTGLLLNSSDMQDRFLKRITELIQSYGLNGISLNLVGLNRRDSRALSSFVSLLKDTMLSIDSTQILTLDLPPLANTSQNQLASALDFDNLNPKVDYYLIQTQRLNITATRIPFSLSPLYADEINSRGSIETAMAFYTNGKIPMNKLVMSLSYEGIQWPMPDFVPGSRAKEFGTILNYQQVQSILNSALEDENGAVLGFDPAQASAYLNYTDGGRLMQLWFTETRGLAAKYEWVLKNNLGGVALKSMGTDSETTELWDVLGASLIQVDSAVRKTQKIEVVPTKKSHSIWSYLKTYSVDIQWAGLNDIYIGNPTEIPEKYCGDYDNVPNRDEIRLSADTLGIENYWQYQSEFTKYAGTKYYAIDSDEECICLLGRWDRYTEINGIAFLSLLLLLGTSILITFFGVKRHGEEWSLRGIFIGLTITSGLLAFITLFFYLFFNTQFKFIGAGSNEVTIWGLITIFSLGILAGIIIHRLRISKTFTQRDLP